MHLYINYFIYIYDDFLSIHTQHFINKKRAFPFQHKFVLRQDILKVKLKSKQLKI